MAHTTTLRAQGAACASDARLRRPCSSRASRYFISPACPSATQRGKYSNSGASSAGVTPTRSNPASVAARITTAVISVDRSMMEERTNQIRPRQSQRRRGSKLELLLHFFSRENLFLTGSAYKLFLTESRNSCCAFSEFLYKGDHLYAATHPRTNPNHSNFSNQREHRPGRQGCRAGRGRASEASHQ